MFRGNKKGVTIVELLAVIVIMGIIAVIAVPTIGTLIENQRVKSAVLTGNVALDSLRLYYLDNPITNDSSVELITDNTTADPLETLINGYVNDVPNIDGVTVNVSANGNISLVQTQGSTAIKINQYTVSIADDKFQPLGQ